MPGAEHPFQKEVMSMGDCLLCAVFIQIAEVARILGATFSTVRVMH
jgi:hypothetical protein